MGQNGDGTVGDGDDAVFHGDGGDVPHGGRRDPNSERSAAVTPDLAAPPPHRHGADDDDTFDVAIIARLVRLRFAVDNYATFRNNMYSHLDQRSNLCRHGVGDCDSSNVSSNHHGDDYGDGGDDDVVSCCELGDE